MNIQKASFIIIFIASFSLFFCTGNNKNITNLEDMNNIIHENEALALFMLPDSLRSLEQKELFMQLEDIAWESWAMKNGKFEMVLSKHDWIERGIPEIFYDKFRQEMDITNNFLDTVPAPYPQLIEESWIKARAEYFARKESQHLE